MFDLLSAFGYSVKAIGRGVEASQINLTATVTGKLVCLVRKTKASINELKAIVRSEVIRSLYNPSNDLSTSLQV